MRIISGRLKGVRLNPPANLPVQPTKDMAKESLFNILNNLIDFESVKVLDLFSGTGSVSVEFASRGVPEVVSVDKSMACFKFLHQVKKQYELNAILPNRGDALKFLEQDTGLYDLIFADPPYDMPQLPQIPYMVFDRNLLKPGGMLIVEHPSTKKIDTHPYFREQRKYGYSSFSFFIGGPTDLSK